MKGAAAETWLQIVPAAVPTSLEAMPPDLEFDVEGIQRVVHLLGRTAGGASLDMSSPTAGTRYAVESRTGNVVTVSPEGSAAERTRSSSRMARSAFGCR